MAQEFVLMAWKDSFGTKINSENIGQQKLVLVAEY